MPAQISFEKEGDDDLYLELQTFNNSNERFIRFIQGFNPKKELCSNLKEIFAAMGIKPTNLQKICLDLFSFYPNLYLNPGIGIGKTTLAYSIIIFKALSTN